MTFKQIKAGRVFLAVFIIAAISTAVFMILYTGYAVSRMVDTVSEMDPGLSQKEQNDIIMDEMEKINAEISENPGWLNNLMIAHWVITTVVTFLTALWATRRYATSSSQGAGYGIMIGIGSMLFYGMCVFTSTVNVLGQVAMLILLIAFAGIGGQIGGNAAQRRTGREFGAPDSAPPDRGAAPMPPGLLSAPPGGDATVYYNMGVAAAIGGRREEARQHFGRVLQFQPRNVAAWLQLANLADTPVHAWEYIQQARAIKPNDPAVVQAVAVIWPQVKDQIPNTVPTNQAPYKGGAMDDTAIPRTTLPKPDSFVPPDAPASPAANDEDH